MLTGDHKPLMMNYTANILAILSLFYVETNGLDISLMNSCQGISGGENWKQALQGIHHPRVLLS